MQKTKKKSEQQYRNGSKSSEENFVIFTEERDFMMRNPLHYQLSEYDCGPTSMMNALAYLFERRDPTGGNPQYDALLSGLSQ